MISDTPLQVPLHTITPPFQIPGIYSAFENYWHENFSFSGELHDFWECVYVDSGEVETTKDERVFILREGDFLLYAPMEFHKIRSSSETHPHLYVMSFPVDGAIPENLKTDRLHLENPEDRTLLRAACQKLSRYFEDSAVNAKAGQLGLQEFTLFLLRLSIEYLPQNRLVPPQSQAAWEYRKLVTAMKQALYQNVSLTEIAASCQISISYMKKLFLRYAGMSPKHYYTDMRAMESLNLLQQGYSAEETAEKMNFSSPNYFSLFFKRHFGLPPALYTRVWSKNKK